VVRMGQGTTVNKVFENKLEGNRRRGRPRLRWLEKVVKDLQELKVKDVDRWQLIGKYGRP